MPVSKVLLVKAPNKLGSNIGIVFYAYCFFLAHTIVLIRHLAWHTYLSTDKLFWHWTWSFFFLPYLTFRGRARTVLHYQVCALEIPVGTHTLQKWYEAKLYLVMHDVPSESFRIFLLRARACLLFPAQPFGLQHKSPLSRLKSKSSWALNGVEAGGL